MLKQFTFLMLVCLTLNAIDYGTPIGPDQQIQNSIRIGNDWYIEAGNDENTYWKIDWPTAHWRTPGEWWSGEFSAKDDPRFFFDYWTWRVGTPVRISMAKGCYVVENLLSGQLAYAYPVDPCRHCIPVWSVIETFQGGFFSVAVVNRLFKCNGQHFIRMTDGSYWEVVTVKRNAQWWKEWWNGIQPPQPDRHFLFPLSKWEGATLTLRGLEGCLIYLLEDYEGNVAFVRYVNNSQALEAYLNHMDEMAHLATVNQVVTDHDPVVVQEAPQLPSHEVVVYNDPVVVQEGPDVITYKAPPLSSPDIVTYDDPVVVQEAPPLSDHAMVRRETKGAKHEHYEEEAVPLAAGEAGAIDKYRQW